MAFTTEVDQLAKELDALRGEVRYLNGAVHNIGGIINLESGTITNLSAGPVILSPTGIEIQDKNTGGLTEDATIGWKESGSSLSLGSIGAFFSTINDLVTLDLYGNMDHGLTAGSSNGGLELAAGSSEAASSRITRSFLFMFANGSTFTDAFEIVSQRIEGTTSLAPSNFLVRHYWNSSYAVYRFQPGKPTGGHPSAPEEGMFYYNTASSGIFMYVNAAWRTLSSF